MKNFCIALLLLATSSVISDEARDLRTKGQIADHDGNSALAHQFYSESARLGDPTAQVELALLLETGGAGALRFPEAYAWFSVVVARKVIDTEFANARILALEERMSSAEMQHAIELAIQYKERYAQEEND